MNPLTNVKNLQKLNQRELALGLTNKKSWHDQYKDSAWIFVGGLPYDLTDGDIICVFSQYGEIVNINLVRDKKSGKSKGYCFICYEDQRSTVLAVDNFNGIKLLGRTLRVDHVEEYKKPKEHGDEDEVTMKLRTEGCAPQIPKSPEHNESEEEPVQVKVKPKKEKVKKVKKEKKSKKKKKKATKSSSSESESDSESDSEEMKVKVKKEKHDPGYDKALKGNKRTHSPDSESRKVSKYRKEDRKEYKNRSDPNRNENREVDDYQEMERGYRDEKSYDRSRERKGDYDSFKDRSKDRSGRDHNKKSQDTRSRERTSEYDRYDNKSIDRSDRDYYLKSQDRNDRSYSKKTQDGSDDEYYSQSGKGGDYYGRDGKYGNKYGKRSDRDYDRNGDRSEKYRKDDLDGYSDRNKYRDSRR